MKRVAERSEASRKPDATTAKSPIPGDRHAPVDQISRVRGAPIELHIGELVLHGFSPADGRPIADAIEGELTRLFTQEGLPPALSRSFEIARVNSDALRIGNGERRESTGTGVARAIFGGLGG